MADGGFRETMVNPNRTAPYAHQFFESKLAVK